MYQSLKGMILSILRKEAIKLAFRKLFGVLSMGGIKGWVVKLAINYGFDKLVVPLVNLLMRKGLYAAYKIEGKIQIKQVYKAEAEGNEEDYIDNVGDIFRD